MCTACEIESAALNGDWDEVIRLAEKAKQEEPDEAD
jgi:hypothetical protein